MSHNLLQSFLVFTFSITFLVSQSSCSPLPRLIESSAHESSVLGAHPEDVAMADVSPFQGVHLHHVARETSDVNRMVEFYQKVLGFQKLETPQSFGDFNVTWLRLPPVYQLHVVERDPKSRLPESPFVVPSDANADVSALWRGPHLSFRVSDYDAAIDTLKRKDIKYFEKTQQEGKVKQCFFFDPDGNGLEIGNWPVPE